MSKFLINSAGTLGFFTSNTERIKIVDGGNVGIGATTPGDKLTVQGNISGSSDLCLVDNGKIRLGDSSDLEIYHDGSESYIEDKGTGRLFG